MASRLQEETQTGLVKEMLHAFFDSCVNNNNTESQQTLFFLTCVSPEVCLEVRALEIGLPATRGAADIITPTGEL